MKRCVALLSLALHLVVFAALPTAQRINQTPDYIDNYEPAARHLLAGEGYTNLQGEFLTRYPPGFSLTLAPVFAFSSATGMPESWGLDLLITGCGIASTLLLFLASEALFSRRIALIAALLWTSYPFYLYLTKQPNPESPFLVCILAAFYGWARLLTGGGWRWAVATGIAAGLATLIRPISLFLPILLALTAAGAGGWKGLRSRVAPAVVLLAASILPLLPWEILVWQRTGQWILVSSNSSHSTFDGLTFALEAKASGQILEVDPEVRWLMQEVWDHRRELPTTGSMIGLVADRFSERPGAVIKLLLLKAARSWYGTQAQWHERIITIIQIPYLLLIGFGLWRLRRQPGLTRTYLVFVLLATFYFWSLSILVLPLLRYMVPVISMLLPAGAAVLEPLLPQRLFGKALF